jgi:hypothetical protein
MSSTGSPWSRRRLAVARQRDPVTVVGLDDHVQVELDATIGAHPQIIDAVCASREAALEPPIDRKIKSGSVQWNRFLAGKDGVHAHAVVRNSGEIEFHFVNLLAPHCRILSHCISPGNSCCLAGSPTPSRTGDHQDDMFGINYFRRICGAIG